MKHPICEDTDAKFHNNSGGLECKDIQCQISWLKCFNLVVFKKLSFWLLLKTKLKKTLLIERMGSLVHFFGGKVRIDVYKPYDTVCDVRQVVHWVALQFH